MLMTTGNEFEKNQNLGSTSAAGAMPKRLRHLNLERTGPYLHAKGDRMTVFFQGEGEEDRSFTLVNAVGRMGEELRMDRNGIAIIDNDNWAVVADECYCQPSGVRGASSEQAAAFASLATLDWAEFSHFVRNQERFRSHIASDITSESVVPGPGSFENLIRLGLRGAGDRDLRDDFLRSIDDAGDYSFPRANRKSMIDEILTHPTVTTRDGKSLGWDVRMNFDWDRDGHMEDGEEVDALFDERWNEEYSADDALFVQACEKAVQPYIEDSFQTLGMENAECMLEVVGINGGFVAMTSFNDTPLTFKDHTDLGGKLESMQDEDLMSLWASVRVLGSDFSRKSRSYEVRLVLNEIRAEHEQEWAHDIEPELEF